MNSVSFSPDGRRLASGSWDKTVRNWDSVSGAKLACLRGHEESVLSVLFSPDGRRLASRSSDNKMLRIWDVHQGECLQVFKGVGDVAAIAIGPPQCPYWALIQKLETVIESATRRQAAAWFPIAPHVRAAHPSGRTWAGPAGEYVCLFTLEGSV